MIAGRFQGWHSIDSLAIIKLPKKPTYSLTFSRLSYILVTMAITRLQKHNKCPVKAVKIHDKANHYAQLICTRHKKHIQWLSRQQFHLIIQSCPTAIGKSGIKARSLRPSLRKDYKFQKKQGNTWSTEYQFVQ